MTAFHNLNPDIKPKGFIDAIKWRLTSKRQKWPKFMPNEYDDIPPAEVKNDELRVSFVGHHTFLIQANGLNILTDPVWSMRASPFNFIGPKRVTEPGIKLENLPKIDLILVSHNHYDHLDIPTLKALHRLGSPKIIAPLGNDKPIKAEIKQADISLLNWYESYQVKEDVTIHLEPAQHWSARGLFDRNQALWGSFVINIMGKQIYFAGDSGYEQKMFQDTYSRFPNIICSIIPIGAYEPRWFMSPIHMNPEEAVKTHQDLRSSYSIAGHFGAFQLTDEGYDEPVIELTKAKRKLGVKDEFMVMKIGSHIILPLK